MMGSAEMENVTSLRDVGVHGDSETLSWVLKTKQRSFIFYILNKIFFFGQLDRPDAAEGPEEKSLSGRDRGPCLAAGR